MSGDLRETLTAVLMAHARIVPDLDEGEPLSDVTVWTCTECQDEQVGVGEEYEQITADHQADVVLATLGVVEEWGVRSPEGTVVPKPEHFARKRYHDDPEFWSLVSRQTSATEWRLR